MGAKRNIATNMAVRPKTEAEQREALRRIALGEPWQAFKKEIEEKVADYEPSNHVRQACERALEYMAKNAVESF